MKLYRFVQSLFRNGSAACLTHPLISATVKMLPNWAAYARASANFAMSGASLCSGMLGINS